MNFPKRGEMTQKLLDMNKPGTAREPASKPQPMPPRDECPKCGKKVGRGKYMHVKNCKG